MEAKCAILFALIACLEIVSIEGIRPFWPEKKIAETIVIDTIEANYKRELGESSHPNNLKGQVKSAVVKNQGHFGKSGTAAYNDEEDFRPTTPGNSPGAGHKSLQGSEPKTLVGVGKYFATGTKEDYRPTQPGHSPGVGHAFQENVKPRP
ncbi:precursor of CEP9-like [Rosa sericea]